VDPHPASDAGLIDALDESHEVTCRSQRRMLTLIAETDRREAWRDSGARDMAHWISMRYGISCWKARRWIAAGHALRNLLRLAASLASGEVGIDKVVELARFATPETESDPRRLVQAGLVRGRAPSRRPLGSGTSRRARRGRASTLTLLVVVRRG
jgi:hypothetical protein